MSVFYSTLLTRSVIFCAVMDCRVVALSVFYSDILTWSADSLYSVIFSSMTHKLRALRVTEYAYYVTNFAKTLVWKQEYDIKL